MTLFKPDSNKEQEITGLYSFGNQTKDFSDDLEVPIESSDPGEPFPGCCGSGTSGAISDCDWIVNAGTTASIADNALGEATMGCGDTLHFWSSNGSVNFDVQEGSAIVDIVVTPAGGAGPQGPQGELGPQGPQGDQGLQGEKCVPVLRCDDINNDGSVLVNFYKVFSFDTSSFLPTLYDANFVPGYVIQGTEVACGTEGIPGPVGAQGAQGNPGVDGVDGAVGPQGPQGEPGAAITLAELCAIINAAPTIAAADAAFVFGIDSLGNCGVIEILDDCP